MNENRMSKWLLTLFYLLAFILLWEWLIPVAYLTETGYLSLFLLFIVISFLFAIYNVSWRYSAPIKIIYVFWAVHLVYLNQVFFSWQAVKILSADIFSNIAIVGQGNWIDITNPFRTILFYALLWMITYLIQYWIETKRSMVLFYIMTVVFIAFIDTFTNYSAGNSIVRVMAAGLFLLGLLSISKLIHDQNEKFSLRGFYAFALPLVGFLLLSLALVVFLPKQEPIWPDPVPYFVSLVDGENGDGEGLAKSGYSPDDSRLGGAFAEDDSVVFEAEVPSKQYWKIETKNIYTSKGWEQRVHENNRSLFNDYLINDIAPTLNSEDVEIAKLTMFEKYPFLIYPYGLTRITTTQNASFAYYFESNQYQTNVDYVAGALDSYEMEFLDERVSLKSLRETKMSELEMNPEIFADALQLPDNLPQRVYELAESVTASSESVYDKTKAVERYFEKSGFMYSKKDVAIPNEDEDYVDQFLFETKKGYCDNFSTSMVVMLRAVGIPARWVKGFAPGELIRNPASGEPTYRVTNNEAHSWVEAHMPGIGWLPFEPTIGFNGQTRIEYDLELTSDDPEVAEMPEQERKEIEKEEPKEVKKDNDPVAFSESLKAIGSWFLQYKWLMLIIPIILLIGFAILFVLRRKWLPRVLVSLSKRDDENWMSFEKRYLSLLQQLKRFGLERNAGETLSAYAMKIDQYFGEQMMYELTLAYEKGIYGEELVAHDWQHLQELWEDLMNKTVH